MKYLILIGLIISSVAQASWENEKLRLNALNASIISAMANFTCFADPYVSVAKHAWDRTYTKKEPIMLLAQDAGSILIARASHDDCQSNPTVKECKIYWVDSWDKDDLIFSRRVEPVSCPKHLTKKFILNYIKTYLPEQFNVEVLK